MLGALALFASALVTGGIGPWLPFQMLAAAWIGFGAGSLPPARGFAERSLLAGYGALAALVYGMLTNFWFWPFVGSATAYSFVPGAGIWGPTCTASFSSTSPLRWDSTSRARPTCAVLIIVLGRPVLAALRRASRRAVFEAGPEFLG